VELFGRAQAEANMPEAEVVSLVSDGVSHLFWSLSFKHERTIQISMSSAKAPLRVSSAAVGTAVVATVAVATAAVVATITPTTFPTSVTSDQRFSHWQRLVVAFMPTSSLIYRRIRFYSLLFTFVNFNYDTTRTLPK
jgi:hypothetical protein